MEVKQITKNLIPVKTHFFLFFAAMAPILPQVNVFGRQLGISPFVMGTVLAAMPLMWAIAKPTFGFIVDCFRNKRKEIFMLLILTTSAAYCGLYFLPDAPFVTEELGYVDEHMPLIVDFHPYPTRYIKLESVRSVCDINETGKSCDSIFEEASCNWICNESILENSDVKVKYDLMFLKDDNITEKGSHLDVLYVKSRVVPDCSHFMLEESGAGDNNSCVYTNNCNLSCVFSVDNENNSNSVYYGSWVFWLFVLLVCVGTVGFNVTSCITDAICFDVLGPSLSTKYGWQRAWGTIGYGSTALLSGWAVDYFSEDPNYKNFGPAFLIVGIFTIGDLICCRRLKLPEMEKPDNIKKSLGTLLKQPKILIFLLFAIIAGTFDSFIVYYMFWFLEELATETGYLNNIKLLEGLTVAAESFGGELVFFAISGKILRRFGFGSTLTFCLASYGVRMVLISFITNPWHILGIELFMQGPSYALTYSTIVGYAAAVAPEGLSATLQGIVAGMDDGVGFVFGSLIGGLLFSSVGGRISFRLFSAFAFLSAAAHAILQTTVLKEANSKLKPSIEEQENGVHLNDYNVDDKKNLQNDEKSAMLQQI